MTTMTRRTFIHWAGAGAVAAHTVSIADVVRAAKVNPPSAGSQILVVVTLYGGNDGLNTVIPYNDAVYHAMRGTMAYREDQVFLLGESLGLNNSMAGFKTFWDNKQLAFFVNGHLADGIANTISNWLAGQVARDSARRSVPCNRAWINPSAAFSW